MSLSSCSFLKPLTLGGGEWGNSIDSKLRCQLTRMSCFGLNSSRHVLALCHAHCSYMHFWVTSDDYYGKTTSSIMYVFSFPIYALFIYIIFSFCCKEQSKGNNNSVSLFHSLASTCNRNESMSRKYLQHWFLTMQRIAFNCKLKYFFPFLLHSFFYCYHFSRPLAVASVLLICCVCARS